MAKQGYHAVHVEPEPMIPVISAAGCRAGQLADVEATLEHVPGVMVR